MLINDAVQFVYLRKDSSSKGSSTVHHAQALISGWPCVKGGNDDALVAEGGLPVNATIRDSDDSAHLLVMHKSPGLKDSRQCPVLSPEHAYLPRT